MSDKYKKLLENALEYGRLRDYEKSSDCLLQIISETDRYPEAFLYLGRSYHALKLFEKAIQSYKFYLSYKNNSPKGYFFAGRSYLALDLPYKALKCFKKTLELSPDNPEALSLTGIAYLKLKKVSLSVYHLEKAVLAEPGNKSLYNAYLNILYLKGIKDFYSGDMETADQIFSFLIKAGKSMPSILLYLACIKKEKGLINEAISLYENVISQNPDDYLLQIQIIPLLIKAGNNDRAAQYIKNLADNNMPFDSANMNNININRIMAVESFKKNNTREAVFYAKKVLKENYYDNDLHLLIGESYRISEIFDKAENHFRLVINRDETNIQARYGLFMVLWSTERYEELYTELLKAGRLFQNDEIISYYKALTENKLNKSPEETIEHVQAEIKKNLYDPYLYEALADLYLRLPMAELAENWYKRALQINKKIKSAYTGLIKTYHILDKKSKIGAVFKNYLNEFPEDYRIRKYFISHLYLSGKYSQAAKEIEKYSFHCENDSEMMRLQAKCYISLSLFDKGLILYRQLLKENPDNANYLISYAFCLDRMSREKEAVEVLEKSLYFFKTNNTVLLTIGTLYFKLENNEKALNYFKKAMENNEKDWRSYYNVSRVYEKQGLTDLADKFRLHADQYKKNA